ncbi:MAG: phosphate ABC transporter substrate-binding protein PstS family protein [Planctomycetes bacterium]|nr:phosphate ABC transporter substrate-binding protein PstS family protein [Planctomycetota bacterium]
MQRAMFAAVLAAMPAMARAQVAVDENLPHYKPTSGVAGQIKSVGSDTMNNLMTLWAEKFKQVYPNVSVEIEGKGSSTAPPALIAGASNFGPMSRAMKDSEIDAFEQRFGYKPTMVRTAIDMLAVYVNKDNPIAQKGLTLQQIDAIFSKTRKGGMEKDLVTWGDVGLTGEWASKPISLYGRNSASGTYGFFKEHALFKGDYKDSVKEQPGSSSVVQAVASDKFGIGYSGIGYRTADVAVVPLALDASSDAVPADPANVSDYPLARFLYLYVNVAPAQAPDPLRREFLKLVFSQEGQQVVIKDGYLPVSYELAGQDLTKVGVNIKTDY